MLSIKGYNLTCRELILKRDEHILYRNFIGDISYLLSLIQTPIWRIVQPQRNCAHYPPSINPFPRLRKLKAVNRRAELELHSPLDNVDQRVHDYYDDYDVLKQTI